MTVLLEAPAVVLPCRSDPEIFHAPEGERTNSPEHHGRIRAAKALCAHCPLADPCRNLGRELRERGIWGGEDDTERELAGFKPGPRTTLKIGPVHGTEAAAKWHRRQGSNPCGPCLTAEREAHQARAASRLAS